MPTSWAEFSGWALGAFLMGVLFHGFWPYAPAPIGALTIGVILGVLFMLSGKPKARAVGVCLVAFVLGLWRFEVAIPSLPTGLKPLDPTGFARQVEKPDPFGEWRLAITRRIQTALPGDRGALLSGMLYGERGLSPEAKTRFRESGMLHLIAVSGSNVTLLVVIVMRFLLGFGFERRRAFLGLSAGLVLFVLFVQPQAPVVRAAIMGWLVELAPIVGRIPHTPRLLLVAAVTFAVWQPWALLYDVSFALSFLATIGLMTYGTWINHALEKSLPWKTWREVLAATVGATLMTAPYSAWAFGQVSLLGLVTNLLGVPLVPWIMATGLTAIALPSVRLLQLPVTGFLDAVLWISKLPEATRVGTWQNLSTSWLFMFGCYALLWAIYRQVQPKSRLIHKENEQKSPFLSM